MNNNAYLPSEKLRAYVFGYVIIDNDFSDLNHEVGMDIYPNGLSGISITFGDTYTYEDTEGYRSNYGVGTVAIGLHNRIFRLIPSKTQKHFIIALKPGVLPKLLRAPMNELHNQLADLESFMPLETVLPERLSLASSPAQQVEIVEKWLLCKTRHIPVHRDITGCIVSDIMKHSGTVKIEDLCRDYGINKKYLERKFQEDIGVSPKQFSEIMKLNAVIDLLVSSQTKQWLNLSTAAGFTDYSHLHKHTKKFTRHSPQTLRQKLHRSNAEGLLTNNPGVFTSFCILNTSI